MGRFSLAGGLGFVALIAFGIAAFRDPIDIWVGAAFVVTLGLLCASVLGAVLERPRGGVWWLGFAVFGWAYLLAGHAPGLANDARMPAAELARALHPLTWPLLTPQNGRVAATNNSPDLLRRQNNAGRIGFDLLILIFARAGATASCLFTKGLPWRKRPSPASDPAPIP